ncbi:hydantoinase B/oxoprolinase family protein [Streptomyces achromogenes]|uniref:hydantoinase B/oxoprolinase family protein n=1 Tax=Streptomyces achromogenes TaxID=67255 RepID=UPI003A801C76
MTGRQFRVDRGGTFTDIVARRPDGRLLTHTLLSALTGPEAMRRDCEERHRGTYSHPRPPRGDRSPRSLRPRPVRGPRPGARRRPSAHRRPLARRTPPPHRRVPPHGMAGGAPGTLGAHRVERADGTVTGLGGSGSADVRAGDVLVIETPGGGGYGRPSPDPHQAGEEIDDLRAF